jgi:hypothetical protein
MHTEFWLGKLSKCPPEKLGRQENIIKMDSGEIDIVNGKWKELAQECY